MFSPSLGGSSRLSSLDLPWLPAAGLVLLVVGLLSALGLLLGRWPLLPALLWLLVLGLLRLLLPSLGLLLGRLLPALLWLLVLGLLLGR